MPLEASAFELQNKGGRTKKKENRRPFLPFLARHGLISIKIPLDFPLFAHERTNEQTNPIHTL